MQHITTHKNRNEDVAMENNKNCVGFSHDVIVLCF